MLASDLINGEELLALEGDRERATLYNKEVFINFAQVVAADDFSTIWRVVSGCCARPL